MTGLLPRTTGVWSNARAAATSSPSHVRNIRDAGYHTAVIGKTHLWRTGAGPQAGLHAREMDLVLEAWGFDTRIEVNDPIGTGSQGCAYTDHLEKIDYLKPHQDYIRAWITEMRSGSPAPWNQVPAPVPEEEDIDSFIGRTAMEWLANYDQSKPFYLQVQFTGPHDPYDGPIRYREMYDLENVPAALRSIESQSSISSIKEATEKQISQWRVNYYANVSLIDEWVGRIVSQLDSVHSLEDCWIVLCSDHGEMLGDHNRMGKANFYDQSLYVPCFIRPPGGIDALEIHDLIEQIDLTVSLLDMSQADPIEDSLGRSLLTYINGSKPQPKSAVFSELFGRTMVETEEWKLSFNLAKGEVLSLTSRTDDPHEFVNLAHDSDYELTISELISEHIEPLKSRMDEGLFDQYQEYVRTTGRLN